MKPLAWLLAVCSFAAAAQEFPAKPLRIVVPWPPSGNVDITARALAPALGEALGQQVIVENRAGAAGRIGSDAVAKAPADGYTLLLGSSGTITAGPAVFRNLSYDPVKDFVAVGGIQSVPIVLTAASKTPVSSYADYVALAKKKDGQLSIASAGSGSSNHLAIELLIRMADLKLLHVPYKGSGPALTAAPRRSDARRSRRQRLRSQHVHRSVRSRRLESFNPAEDPCRDPEGPYQRVGARALQADGRRPDRDEPTGVRRIRARRLREVAPGGARRQHRRRVN
jgi:hypothetical protein